MIYMAYWRWRTRLGLDDGGRYRMVLCASLSVFPRLSTCCDGMAVVLVTSCGMMRSVLKKATRFFSEQGFCFMKSCNGK